MNSIVTTALFIVTFALGVIFGSIFSRNKLAFLIEKYLFENEKVAAELLLKTIARRRKMESNHEDWQSSESCVQVVDDDEETTA